MLSGMSSKEIIVCPSCKEAHWPEYACSEAGTYDEDGWWTPRERGKPLLSGIEPGKQKKAEPAKQENGEPAKQKKTKHRNKATWTLDEAREWASRGGLTRKHLLSKEERSGIARQGGLAKAARMRERKLHGKDSTS